MVLLFSFSKKEKLPPHTDERSDCPADFCNTYNPNEGRGSKGGDTWIANVNLENFDAAVDFFNQKLNIDRNAITRIETAIMQNFRPGRANDLGM